MSDIILLNATCTDSPIAARSVHLGIFSPPYYGLRAYQGIRPLVWDGMPTCKCETDYGSPVCPTCGGCKHDWGEEQPPIHNHQVPDSMWKDNPDLAAGQNAPTGRFCSKCGAWLGSLGNEPTVEMYIDHMVQVCREVRRVLRDDGQMWLDIGDSYAGSGGAGGDYAEGGLREGQPTYKSGMTIDKSKRKSKRWGGGNIPANGGLKAKDLIGVPWRLALALQADGWWLRSAPPWIKRNCMPDSVRDRPTTAHEYWFQFAKSEKYYADQDAVRKPIAQSTVDRGRYGWNGRSGDEAEAGASPGSSFQKLKGSDLTAADVGLANPEGRYRRTSDFFFESLDQAIQEQRAYLAHLEAIREGEGMLLDQDGQPLAMVFNTRGYKGAHFACYPAHMLEPIIKFATSEKGACPTCGAPWKRETVADYETSSPISADDKAWADEQGNNYATRAHGRARKIIRESAWYPTCACYGQPERKAMPCTACEGSGKEMAYKTEKARKKEAVQTGRADGKVAGPGGKNYKVETGLPCKKCDGEGVRVVDVWPQDVDAWPTAPCTVYDPFVGSGTTLEAARSQGRRGVGVDLSFQYLKEQARERLGFAPAARWQIGQAKAVKQTDLSFGLFATAKSMTTVIAESDEWHMFEPWDRR